MSLKSGSSKLPCGAGGGVSAGGLLSFLRSEQVWRVSRGGVRLPLLPEARPTGVEAEGSPSQGRLPSTLGSAQSRDSRRVGVGPTALGWQGLGGTGGSQASRGTQGAALARIIARITISRPEVPPCGPVPPGRPRTGRGPVGGHTPALSRLRGRRGMGDFPAQDPGGRPQGHHPRSLPPACSAPGEEALSIL